MQKVLFITNIQHLNISSNLGRGERVGDKFFITNDRSYIESLLTPNFTTIAGSLETKYLKTATAVTYGIEECEVFSNDGEAISYLNTRLAKVKLFLQFLWLIKDNSVNADLGYLEHPYDTLKAGVRRSNVSRNFFSLFFSTAEGEVTATEFTRDELRKARDIFKRVPGEIVFHPQSATDDRFGRFERAFYFSQAARTSSDLGVKIANYCTCLEALFSTDSKELSHKLSERVACFLESELEGRLKLFHLIKKAYGIRSRVVHGAGGSKSLQREVIATSISCDHILRRIFLTILENQSLFDRFLSKSEQDA